MGELTRRYVVMAMATEGPFDTRDPEGAFVLKPWKDPAALHALRAYADRCYAELAKDVAAWILAIERGPVVRGDVGRRNEEHLRVATGARRAKPAKRRPSARKTGRTTARRKR